MSETREIALHPAFSFTCEDCGRLSYTSAVPVEDPELQAESQAHFKDLLEATSGKDAAEKWDGELVMAPMEVTCPHCNAVYKVSPQQYDIGELDMFFDDDEGYDDELDDEEFDEDLDDEFDDEFDDDDDEDDWDIDEDEFDEEVESPF